jgi:hypothetical protein
MAWIFIFIYFYFILLTRAWISELRKRWLVFGSALLFVYARAAHASHSPPKDPLCAHFQESTMRLFFFFFLRARRLFFTTKGKPKRRAKPGPATATKHKPQMPQKPRHALSRAVRHLIPAHPGEFHPVHE